MEVRPRRIEFNVSSRFQGSHHLIVSWHCVVVLAMIPASNPEVFLFPSKLKTDIPKVPRLVLVLSLPVVPFFSGFVFNRIAAGRFEIRIAQVKVAVMTARVFFIFAFYGDKSDLTLDLKLLIHKTILMYLLPAVFAEINNLGYFNIVRAAQFNSTTFIVAFIRVCVLEWFLMGHSFFSRITALSKSEQNRTPCCQLYSH